ncbi:cation:proton antiporter [Marinobacter salicampi]|uniref:cation:proton antiporter n=1 Tax=Marinobacter salicampi TaxID=435907 RepID=UPI00140BA1B0|nr:cation:proton antiporter family protein [Marinobacter salicampi]
MAELLASHPFYELSVLLMLAAVVGTLGLILRQPMIVSFIAVGVLAGPSALDLVHSHAKIDLLAELGIAVLLFLVGLKLDLKLVRTLGSVALATGLGQVAFTTVVGFGIALALGLGLLTSLYVAVALTFSSTIIIVKLLTDKKEVDSLHGRVAIGFLIVQDLVVILAMLVLSAFGIGAEESGGAGPLIHVLQVLGYGVALLVLVGLFIRYLADPLVTRIAHSSELLIIFAIAWAALLAAVADYVGLSKELGGLLAGVSLASTEFREAIVARLSSLRDFLLLFFFISLGTQLDLGMLGAQLWPALVLSVFVLVGNPLIVVIIMGFLGFRKRTGFLAGLTVAQISEFSLIFIAMGVSLGHLNTDALGLVTLVGLITIALSVYMISYSQTLYRWFEPALGIFERKDPFREAAAADTVASRQHDVILFGLGRYGRSMAENLRQAGHRILAVDFNPDVVRRWRKAGFDAVYGDATDEELVGTLPLQHPSWVISAMPEHELGVTHGDPRLVLMASLKHHGYQGRVAVSTKNPEERETLLRAGAHLVFMPFQDAGRQAVEMINSYPETAETNY